MPDIHYNDAILTVLFGGGFAFMLWSIRKFDNVSEEIIKSERRMMKKISKANKRGAKIVQTHMDTLTMQLQGFISRNK